MNLKTKHLKYYILKHDKHNHFPNNLSEKLSSISKDLKTETSRNCF